MFGCTLDPNYRQLIGDFKTKYALLSEYTENVMDDDIKLSQSWKMHIILCHLEPWLEAHPVDMCMYAEQACESTHADF